MVLCLLCQLQSSRGFFCCFFFYFVKSLISPSLIMGRDKSLTVVSADLLHRSDINMTAGAVDGIYQASLSQQGVRSSTRTVFFFTGINQKNTGKLLTEPIYMKLKLTAVKVMTRSDFNLQASFQHAVQIDPLTIIDCKFG